jgi:hopene-associated glycosyltransferase HpnB
MGWLEIPAYLALFSWTLVLLDRRRGWPGRQLLERAPLVAAPRTAGGEAPRVAAIVPARDEADLLGRTLPALLQQGHPRFRVVLVDDRSSDGTGGLAGRLALEADCTQRLLVVEGREPPRGWTGKVHAQSQGLAAADQAGAEWLLLTDADILHPPDSAEALLAQAARGGNELVSVMARLRAESFWERLLIPPFVFFFHLLYPFGRASDPRSRVAAAAGGCILVSREALRAAGGFEAISGEIIDDVALARAVRAAGGSRWLGLDPRIASLRAYPRLRDLWRMVARTAFTQLRRRYDLLLWTAAALLLLLVAPPFIFAALALSGRPWGAAAALGGWLIPSAMLLPWARYHGVGALYALGLPAAGLLYLLMTLTSAWDHLRGRGPLWRGARYRP